MEHELDEPYIKDGAVARACEAASRPNSTREGVATEGSDEAGEV